MLTNLIEWIQRSEFWVRSRAFGAPFTVMNALTRYDIKYRERLYEAESMAARRGAGLISFSNHLSLFDDPLVIMAIDQLWDFTAFTKRWWSTACATNFAPGGRDLRSWFIRYFNSVCSMVFLERAHKVGGHQSNIDLAALFEGRLKDLTPRIDEDLARRGMTRSSLCRTLITSLSGPDATKALGLNQPGIMEACIRVIYGQWCHLFPEGGRSRDGELRKGRMGAGKILHHTAGAVLLPFVISGTERVLPVGSFIPRPLQQVRVVVGQPTVLPEELAALPPTVESYRSVSTWMMGTVGHLRQELLGERQASLPATKARAHSRSRGWRLPTTEVRGEWRAQKGE